MNPTSTVNSDSRTNCYFPTPPTARSDAQNFLKSLYAYLTIKQLQEKDDTPSSERALNMALENNFVTKQTSLLVTKDNQAAAVAADLSKISTGNNKYNRNGGLNIKGYSGGIQFSPGGYRPYTRSTSGGYSGGIQSTPAKRRYKNRPSNNSGRRSNRPHSKHNRQRVSSIQGFVSPGLVSGNSVTTTTTTTSTTPNPTTTTPSGPCKLILYSKTYNRGAEETLLDSSDDLGEFQDQAVSAVVTGSCCWTVFSETSFTGQSMQLSPAERYTGVLSLQNLRRNLKSVKKTTC